MTNLTLKGVGILGEINYLIFGYILMYNVPIIIANQSDK